MKDLKKLGADDIEKELLSLEQVEIEVKHSFSKGLYAREIFVPKGTLLVGHKHKVDCLNILASGAMALKGGDDEGVIINAPVTFESKAGIRKVGFALEDCVFINVFNTDETDLEKLEDELIEKSESFLEHQNREKLCHS